MKEVKVKPETPVSGKGLFLGIKYFFIELNTTTKTVFAIKKSRTIPLNSIYQPLPVLQIKPSVQVHAARPKYFPNEVGQLDWLSMNSMINFVMSILNVHAVDVITITKWNVQR